MQAFDKGISEIHWCIRYKYLCTLSCMPRKHPTSVLWFCPFSAYLWSSCRLKLGLPGSPIGTLQDEASLIQSKFKEKAKSTMLAKMALAATLWHLWKERNQRVFQLQEHHKIMVFRKLYEDIRILLITYNWKSERENDMKLVLSSWNAWIWFYHLCMKGWYCEPTALALACAESSVRPDICSNSKRIRVSAKALSNGQQFCTTQLAAAWAAVLFDTTSSSNSSMSNSACLQGHIRIFVWENEA